MIISKRHFEAWKFKQEIIIMIDIFLVKISLQNNGVKYYMLH